MSAIPTLGEAANFMFELLGADGVYSRQKKGAKGTLSKF
jgi:hypothetical protein